MLEESALTEQVIGSAIEVHRHWGPGLLETAYQKCLAREFRLRDIEFQAEVALPVEYKGIRLETGFRLDFLVAGRIIIEVKSVESIGAVHEAQLLTYLRLSGCPVGLLINFNVPVLKKGILRCVMTKNLSA